jgi:hypothetical protein
MRAPTTTGPTTAAVPGPQLRIPRYAVLAALVAAFALGRCTGSSREARDEAALQEASPIATPPATRGSAVMRRESATAEEKAPRTPR